MDTTTKRSRPSLVMVTAHALEAPDRAILNLLYQHAHDSGRLGDPAASWELPITTLRPSKHNGTDRIRDCLSLLNSAAMIIKARFPAAPLPDWYRSTADSGEHALPLRSVVPKCSGVLLDLRRQLRIALRDGKRNAEGPPDDLATMKPLVVSSPALQLHHAAFEEQILAQRIRNASAAVRVRQKVVRERREPVRPPK